MDLTTRLRAACGHDSRSVDGCTNCEAADEIERLRQALPAERERCAKLCDELHDTWRWDNEPDSSSGPRDCAAAIRAGKSERERAAQIVERVSGFEGVREVAARIRAASRSR